MTAKMQWQRVNETCMRCAPWQVARVTLRGAQIYELWHDKTPAMIGRFDTFEAAKNRAMQLEFGGQG